MFYTSQNKKEKAIFKSKFSKFLLTIKIIQIYQYTDKVKVKYKSY
jgi:hypothetical protein